MKRTIFMLLMVIFVVTTPFAQESFFNNESEKSPISISGNLIGGSRYILNPDSLNKLDTNDSGYLKLLCNTIPVIPYMETTLNFKYKNENIETLLSLKNNINGDFNNLTPTISEAYIHLFLPSVDLLAGYTKLVWGTGDGMHVIDRLNPTDYRDFINRDYLDRRVAEKMLKVGVTIGETGYLEFVYEPVFTPDIYPESGMWLPSKARELLQIEQQNITVVIPNTNTFLYSQLAARYTFSTMGVDLGFSDYFGFIRDPVIDMSKLLTEGKVILSYDRVNAFGIEASTAIGGFDTWLEGAYNLTSDYKGDNPLIHNNSIQYLFGIDREIPIHNLYINLQLMGSYTLNNDKIKPGDIQYNSEGKYTLNTLAGSISDTFFENTLKLKLDGAYQFEYKDFMLRPTIQLVLTDNLKVNLSYTSFWGDTDTDFGQFSNNNFVDLNINYTF